MRSRGQNLVEFSIIVALIAICSILALTMLGGDINSLIGTAANKVMNFKPFGDPVIQAAKAVPAPLPGPAPAPIVGPVIPSKLPPGALVLSPDVKNISYNPDGTVDFKVGNQTITLPSNVVQLQNTVNQTTGASGDINNLINEIAYMITQHESEFPAGKVPVNINFGDGIRELAGETYKGAATANTTSIQVGSHVVIVQQDHSCVDDASAIDYGCSDVGDQRMGYFRIEGLLDNNTFDGMITSDIAGFQNQTYKASFSNDSYSGSFPFIGDQYTHGDPYDVNWKFDFSNNTPITVK